MLFLLEYLFIRKNSVDFVLKQKTQYNVLGKFFFYLTLEKLGFVFIFIFCITHFRLSHQFNFYLHFYPDPLFLFCVHNDCPENNNFRGILAKRKICHKLFLKLDFILSAGIAIWWQSYFQNLLTKKINDSMKKAIFSFFSRKTSHCIRKHFKILWGAVYRHIALRISITHK